MPGNKSELFFNSGGGGTVGSDEVEGANCTLVTDVVGMGGRGVPSQLEICDNFSSGLRIQDPDGLFGMPPYVDPAVSPVAFPPIYWNLVHSGQIPGPEFGISMVSDRPGREGVLTLGGTDRTQYLLGTLKTIPLNWPLSESRSRWVVDVQKGWIAPGGRKGAFRLTNATNAVTLVDTGSATIVTPDIESTAQLYAQMSPLIQPLDRFGSWGAPCDVLDRVVRDITFTVGTPGQHTDVVVRKEYVNVGEYPGMPGSPE